MATTIPTTPAPPASIQMVLYSRPTDSNETGPLRQFVFDGRLGTVATARAMDLAVRGGQTVAVDTRGYFVEKGTPAPAPVTAFNDAMVGASSALASVKGNAPEGLVEMLGMALVQPGALTEFLKEFPADHIAAGVTVGDRSYGWVGAAAQAPQVLRDAVAGAQAVRDALPKLD